MRFYLDEVCAVEDRTVKPAEGFVLLDWWRVQLKVNL